MRRYYALTAAGKQLFDYGAGERLPLVGVGASAQLVDENEAVGIYAVYYLYNRLYVLRECGKALFYALTVAEVAEYVVEHAHAAAFGRGNEQSARRHQAEEAHHF